MPQVIGAVEVTLSPSKSERPYFPLMQSCLAQYSSKNIYFVRCFKEIKALFYSGNFLVVSELQFPAAVVFALGKDLWTRQLVILIKARAGWTVLCSILPILQCTALDKERAGQVPVKGRRDWNPFWGPVWQDHRSGERAISAALTSIQLNSRQLWLAPVVQLCVNDSCTTT